MMQNKVLGWSLIVAVVIGATAWSYAANQRYVAWADDVSQSVSEGFQLAAVIGGTDNDEITTEGHQQGSGGSNDPGAGSQVTVTKTDELAKLIDEVLKLRKEAKDFALSSRPDKRAKLPATLIKMTGKVDEIVRKASATTAGNPDAAKIISQIPPRFLQFKIVAGAPRGPFVSSGQKKAIGKAAGDFDNLLHELKKKAK
jgi:hypothetical protein